MECPIEGDLASGVNGVDLAVMHLVRRHQPDACMVVVLVVPVEERAAEASGILLPRDNQGENPRQSG